MAQEMKKMSDILRRLFAITIDLAPLFFLWGYINGIKLVKEKLENE